MISGPCRQASLACSLCLVAVHTHAHSFGTPYVLPVPFWMYVYGCAATLIATFALLGFFAGEPATSVGIPSREIGAAVRTRIVDRRALWLLRIGATGCLLLTIVAGLIGNTDPARNIGMSLFWVFFLLGFAYLTLLAGDLYALINPWKLAVERFERSGFDLSSGRFHYPEGLAYWPAFLFYVALLWLELFAPASPLLLSIALLIYSITTIAGVALFGKTTWFRKAEVFSVYFRLIGKLAPVEYIQAPGGTSWQLRLRAPFVGALEDRPEHMSLVLFVLFMLSSTTYDAIQQTALWIGLFWRNLLSILQPLWGTDLGRAQDLLMGWYLVYRQAGLVVLPFLYLGSYLLILLPVKALLGATVSLRSLALSYCYSLLPIALAYNFTHYFTWLIAQGRNLPSLLSDPFGFGWNLLGIGETSEPTPLQMGVIWHTQVAVLLAGHLVSIYLAHVIAARTTVHRSAVLSQLPLLCLMVVYTIIGLWILSLPLGAD